MLLVGLGAEGVWPAAQGVILFGSGDPAFNTERPTGSLAGSGWDEQGYWGPFLGTPIGPYHFITATHVGGGIGESFFFRDVPHKAIARFVDSRSDLSIWQVSTPFPAYAGIYTGTNEVERPMVVFGRGGRRGGEVRSGPVLKGWRWGVRDGRMRWGENRIDAIVTFGSALPDETGATAPRSAELLEADFDADGGPNEAHLSIGDSGGASFIQNNFEWKLAGIHFSVTGPYNQNDTGTGFDASLLDEGGLHTGGETNWTMVPHASTNQPGRFYSTRISARVTWIQSVLRTRLTDATPKLESSRTFNGNFTARPDVHVNIFTRTVRVPLDEDATFFRFDYIHPLTIKAVQVNHGMLVLQYD